jgi:hypothetical protein
MSIDLTQHCPLSLVSVTPTSTVPQPYTEPIGYSFIIDCETAMEHPFEVHFFYMNLQDSGEDIPLLDEPYEIDPLPAGRSEFELEVEMVDHNKIPFDELIHSHGIEIKIKCRDKWVARRGCEVVIAYVDEEEMEKNMPDEILASHLTIANLGVRGAPPRQRANITTTTTRVTACGADQPQQQSGQVRSREETETEEKENGPVIPAQQQN